MKGSYKRSFLLSVMVVVVLVCSLRFPRDDGLRHVGLAFSDQESEPISLSAVSRSWGTTYPFSYFEVFKGYDPWFGYDLILRIIATGLKCLPISSLLSEFLLIKILSILFSLTFYYLILKRCRILEDINDQDSFTVAYIVMLALTVLPSKRMLIARPFAFGTLFLVYAIGQRGILKGLISSAVLSFLYPYLAWFYTIPAALAHFLKGDKRFALGTISFTILFLWFQPPPFWGFQLALFRSQLVRNSINPKITEFASSFDTLFFFIYLFGFVILYPMLSRKVKKLNVENLLIILYLAPSMKYVRYFVDIVLPLLFVSFGQELLTVLMEPYRKLTSYWRNSLASSLQKLKLSRTQPHKARDINLKPYLVALYVLVSILVIQLNHKQFSSLKEFHGHLSIIPARSTVLTPFNLQYKVLYVRPDLRIIPSCEIGFPRNNIRKEYLSFLNEGEVLPLAIKTKAQFFLENKKMYINPENGDLLQLAGKEKSLRIWRVLHRPEPDIPSQKKALGI